MLNADSDADRVFVSPGSSDVDRALTVAPILAPAVYTCPVSLVTTGSNVYPASEIPVTISRLPLEMFVMVDVSTT
jgi:hypothetical protein